MASVPQNQTEQNYEQVYEGNEPAGIAVLVACGMLSAICVLGMFVVLGLSARGRSTSDKPLFVRTHVAIYFFSLLLCNLAQAIGGILSITWVIEHRVHVSVTCTAQATIKQLGNVGTAIFSFVIATHTFSLLFLRRQWSDRTCYIILIVSWALLSLDLSVENFVLAKPKTLGPYYGVAGYWCWITPAYSVERYTTSYLFMFVSAVLSFVLYLLVFFRLRGNITLSGYKLYFHRHPKLRVGRTSDGTSVSTDDRRVGSHLTRVAQHMLWYPLVYTLLVLPQAAARFASFSGRSVPFSVTILTSSVFMLHGCINTMLFCTTRNVLPGGWRQRVGLSTSWDGVRDDIDPSNRTNPTWRFTGLSAKVAPVSGMGVEKGVEVMHGRAYPASYLGSSSPSSPAFPRPHSDGGEQLADTRNHHTRQLPPRDTRMHIHAEADGDDGDTDFDAGVDPTITARIIQSHAPPRPSEYDLTTPAPSIKVPAPVHLLSPTPPMVDDHQWQSYSSSISTSETIVPPVRLSQASGEC